jgi:hypothetical protein
MLCTYMAQTLASLLLSYDIVLLAQSLLQGI